MRGVCDGLTLESTRRLTVCGMDGVTVSGLAHKAGISPHTVRYYERRGLLPVAARSDGGYRIYDPALVDRLRFIRGAKRVGLRLDDIAELLEVMDRGQCPCGHTDGLLRRRLAEINDEIIELATVRDELTRLLDTHPPSACADGAAETWWCRDEFAGRR
jgi:DNA-binding transcriptional MerR regulator